MTPDWKQPASDGDDAPAWLSAIAQREDMLDDLLKRRMLVDGSTVEEPSIQIVDWLLMGADDDSLLTDFDNTLRMWIERRSEGPSGEEIEAETEAWMQVAAILLDLPDLEAAGGALTSLSEDWQRRFASSIASHGDSFVERLLSAIAVVQKDRRLAAVWWRLCGIPEGLSPDLGFIGVLGIQHLPASETDERGGFRWDVVEALATLGQALHERCIAGLLSDGTGYSHFAGAIHLFEAAYPFPERWTAALSAMRSDPALQDWATRVLSTRGRVTDEDHILAAVSPAAAGRQSEPASESPADSSYDMVRRAVELREREPARAAELSRAAVEHNPENPYAWTTLMRSIYNLGQLDEAVHVGWAAASRFPNNAVCWQELATFLSDNGRPVLAEEAWREAIERDPEDAHPVGSFGLFLTDQGEFEEAIDVLKPFVDRHPDDLVPRVGLGHAYADAGAYEKAAELLHPLVDAGLDNSYAWSGFLKALRGLGEFDAAAGILKAAKTRFPDVAYFRDFDLRPRSETSARIRRVDRWEEPRSRFEALLLRRGYGRALARGMEVASDLDRLITWLHDAGRLVLTEPDRVAEASLALLVGGDLPRAFATVTDQGHRYRYSLRLAEAEVRVNRAVATENETVYTTSTFRELLSPLERARRNDPLVRPLLRLAAVRLAESLRNGTAVETRRADLAEALDRDLRQPVVRSDAETFMKWWSRHVNHALSDALSGEPQAEARLDRLAEDFAERLSATRSLEPIPLAV